MATDYLDVDDAMGRDGLRMVVVTNVPSPWGEAAKGVFHIKGIEWSPVALAYDNPKLFEWTGCQNAPAAVYNNEPARTGWSDILHLAERIAPTPALIPGDAIERTWMFGLCHELLGEGGLGWARRLQLVEAGLKGEGGFPDRIAQYIGAKYGYSAEAGAQAGARVVDLLSMLSARLTAQRDAGSAYYVGNTVSAADVYSATCLALFAPLPPDKCAMAENTRAAFETLDAATSAALDPILTAHRDMMYAKHLALPLSL